jgi:hypothetical protein
VSFTSLPLYPPGGKIPRYPLDMKLSSFTQQYIDQIKHTCCKHWKMNGFSRAANSECAYLMMAERSKHAVGSIQCVYAEVEVDVSYELVYNLPQCKVYM